MLFKKKIEEVKNNKKEFIKNDVIETIKKLAVSRRIAHEAGWEYEEIDRWITEEAREQFAKFEAKSSEEMTVFLMAETLKAFAELAEAGAIDLHVEEADE